MKSYQAVIDLYATSEIKESIRDIHESLGFIVAISLSPQSIELQNWLPLLAKQGGELSFSNEQLASDFASVTLAFNQQCLTESQALTPLNLPSELWLDDNDKISQSGHLFAIGFLSGFNAFESMWDALASNPESEQILQTTMLLLSKMAGLNSEDPQMQALFEQLPSMAEIVDSVPTLLSALGHVSVVCENE